jgi:hypothetical protein
MAGGVSANRTLRAKLAEMMQKRRGEVFYARPEFCTDNGAMIAYAGMVRLNAGATSDLSVRASALATGGAAGRRNPSFNPLPTGEGNFTTTPAAFLFLPETQ